MGSASSPASSRSPAKQALKTRKSCIRPAFSWTCSEPSYRHVAELQQKKENFDPPEKFLRGLDDDGHQPRKDSQGGSSEEKEEQMGKKRGPYRQQVAVKLTKMHPASYVSSLLGIPAKNIKRWSVLGYQRKKGGGRRPADPEMQAKLISLIESQQVSCREQILRLARELACAESFQASKGWLTRFMRRHNLRRQTETKQSKISQKEEIYLNENSD